jgi:hypothetical protein
MANLKTTTVTGTLYSTGNIIGYYSDERLKTKTGEIENALDKIKAISPFYYIPNETAKNLGLTDNSVHVGVSAQEVQTVLPEAVKTAPFDIGFLDESGVSVSKTGENYLTVQYERIVPLLVQAIKDQQVLIEQQQKQIDELKTRLDGTAK